MRETLNLADGATAPGTVCVQTDVATRPEEDHIDDMASANYLHYLYNGEVHSCPRKYVILQKYNQIHIKDTHENKQSHIIDFPTHTNVTFDTVHSSSNKVEAKKKKHDSTFSLALGWDMARGSFKSWDDLIGTCRDDHCHQGLRTEPFDECHF